MFLAVLWPSLCLPDVMPRQRRIPSVVGVGTGKSPGVQNMSPASTLTAAQVKQVTVDGVSTGIFPQSQSG